MSKRYEAVKRWRGRHPDGWKKMMGRYREKHRIELRRKNKEWKKKNPDKIAGYKRRAYVKYYSLITSLKSGGCVVCGEKTIVCLDFHHVDPTEKEYAISSISSMKRTILESAKCVILCSNCHRKFHNGLITLKST